MLYLERKAKESSLGRNRHIIFPTNSPVDALGGKSDVQAPPDGSGSDFTYKLRRLRNRIKPLLMMREKTDEVYSKGYFERHYPDADKELKSLLHEKAMAAWGKARAIDGDVEDEEDDHSEGKAINLVINLGR